MELSLAALFVQKRGCGKIIAESTKDHATYTINARTRPNVIYFMRLFIQIENRMSVLRVLRESFVPIALGMSVGIVTFADETKPMNYENKIENVLGVCLVDDAWPVAVLVL